MKVAFHTLGCKVNQYETEAMAEMFRDRGYTVVDEREFADVYVINTCTVTAVADRKSRQYIRRMKKLNPGAVVAVTGCYAQVEPEEIASMDEVDVVTGTNEKASLVSYIEEYMEDRKRSIHVRSYEELSPYEETGIVTSAENRTRAYIKIQEGCDRFCSYCVIPYARGAARSRSLEDIEEEAKKLLSMGYKELVLTGINTALYDMESMSLWKAAAGEEKNMPSEPFGVEKVIEAVNRLPGDFRIRLSSLEPAVVNGEYVKRLFKYDRLCRHLHLSAQSGSDRVLAAMNRPYSRKQYMEIVKTLRDFDPLYGISTDIIVGFPGEREADFEESRSLVEESVFCRTHIFKYSKRPFTAAAKLPGHVAPQVKNRRSDSLHKTGYETAERFFRMNEGRVERVLFEEYFEREKILTGHTGNYIRVYISCESPQKGRALCGTFADVRLISPERDGMRGKGIFGEKSI